MTKRKIALMYDIFGKADGLCKDCKHFLNTTHRDRAYRKCRVYGITKSEASDWKGKQEACGAFNKDVKETNIIRMVKPEREPDEQIEGQISFFGGEL